MFFSCNCKKCVYICGMDMLLRTERLRIMEPSEKLEIQASEVESYWSAIRAVRNREKRDNNGVQLRYFGVRTDKVSKKKYVLRIK